MFSAKNKLGCCRLAGSEEQAKRPSEGYNSEQDQTQEGKSALYSESNRKPQRCFRQGSAAASF